MNGDGGGMVVLVVYLLHTCMVYNWIGMRCVIRWLVKWLRINKKKIRKSVEM